MVSGDFWFVKNNESDKLISSTKAFCDSIRKNKTNVIINIIINMYKILSYIRKGESECSAGKAV